MIFRFGFDQFLISSSFISFADCAPVESGSTLTWDRSSWYDVKPPSKEQNPLVNLPYCIIDNELISQTNAIFVYLGEKLGMLGDSPAQRIQCQALLCELMDLRNATVAHGYGRGPPTDEHLSNICGPAGQFQKLELCLNQNETKYGGVGTFLVGNKASAPDFHLWEMITQAKCLASRDKKADPMTSFPALQKFYKNFTQLPENQRYLTSNLVLLPFNNKAAPFGGAQDMHAWKLGTKYDFHTWSGSVY